jgi:hypothetical protein
MNKKHKNVEWVDKTSGQIQEVLDDHEISTDTRLEWAIRLESELRTHVSRLMGEMGL